MVSQSDVWRWWRSLLPINVWNLSELLLGGINFNHHSDAIPILVVLSGPLLKKKNIIFLFQPEMGTSHQLCCESFPTELTFSSIGDPLLWLSDRSQLGPFHSLRVGKQSSHLGPFHTLRGGKQEQKDLFYPNLYGCMVLSRPNLGIMIIAKEIRLTRSYKTPNKLY